MGDSCDKCVMHDSLLSDFKELKSRVQKNEDKALPVLTTAKAMLDRYPDTIAELYTKVGEANDKALVSREAFKAIHTRMDLNDEQRRSLDRAIEGLRGELKDHMDEEEKAMKSNRTMFITIGLFLIGYLITFGTYIHNTSTYNDTRIQLITQDVSYIKTFVEEIKDAEHAKRRTK